MNLSQIVQLFLENPKRMQMGSGKLAKAYKCKPNEIVIARAMVRKSLQSKGSQKDAVKAAPVLSKNLERNFHPKSKSVGIHIVSGCQHVPFQNKKMQEGLIELIKDLGDKVKGFHLIGDTLDLNSLSAHEPNKVPLEGITLGFEYKEGNKYLDSFEAVLPKNIEKTYIYGNHEDRWRRHISDINNSKYADALPSPKDALMLEKRGYKVYTNWKEDFHLLGNSLQLIHGEFCTKYPARTHVDRMKSSVMFAHTHRIDINYDGEKAGFNIGWGGNPEAPAFNYVSRLTKMNWINGFALVHIDEHGNFFTQVIPVFHNHFWYNGKRY